MAWSIEMAQRYLELLPAALPWMALGGVACAGLAWRRPSPLWTGAVGALAGTVGLIRAIGQASLFDDAFISLRYARNLLDGHGLVWNLDERVEGYTNFLWTVAVAAVSWLTGVELPLVAIAGCLAAFAACVALLTASSERAGPLAAVLFTLHVAALDYATSGLETMANAGLVLAAFTALHRRSPPWVAGLCLSLAVLTRPDAALFWIAGAAAVASLRSPRALLTYALPAVLVLAHLAWRLDFYGDWVPNTAHAKSADAAYWPQGLRYSWAFALASHAWAFVPLAILALVRRRGPEMVFAAVGLALHHLYVARVGGDFMLHRFLLVTLPLWLILAARGVEDMLSRAPRRGVMAAAALGLSAGSVDLIGPGPQQWRITDEARVYPVVSWNPVEIDHDNFKVAMVLRELFDGPIRPTITTSGIGMIGYYTELPVIDLLGLTDRHTATQELVGRRGVPGHEKHASREYVIEERGAVLGRWAGAHLGRHDGFTTVNLGIRLKTHWQLLVHEPALVAHLEERGLRVPAPGPAIDAWVLQMGAADTTLERIEEDAEFFENYYFSHNEDPARRARVSAVVDQHRARQTR